MSIRKGEIEHINTTETKIALLEQSLNNISGCLNEIKSDLHIKLDDLEKEIREEGNIVWKKLESLDQRINDNFNWIIGINITLFSGVYATLLGGMIARLFHWI